MHSNQPFADICGLSERSMQAEAEKLATLLAPGDVIALEGGLGAGKSTFARALIRYLTGDQALDVPSPTFTIVQTYDWDRYEIWHADLYRLESEEDVYDLGFEDVERDAVFLIEWPDRLPQEWKARSLTITFSNTEEHTRDLRFAGNDDWKARLRSFV